MLAQFVLFTDFSIGPKDGIILQQHIIIIIVLYRHPQFYDVYSLALPSYTEEQRYPDCIALEPVRG